MRALLGELHHAAILDVGCGDGTISLQYLSPTNKITLVDLSPNMLERARLSTPASFARNVEYINDDFNNLSGTQFDVVICVGVLAHVDSVESAVAKVASLVKPGGHCVIQLTDCEKLVAKIERSYRSKVQKLRSYRYSTNHTTPSQIMDIALSNSLDLLQQRRYSLLLPGMGKLPDGWLYRFQKLTLDAPLLSKHGSEVILHFEKGSLA